MVQGQAVVIRKVPPSPPARLQGEDRLLQEPGQQPKAPVAQTHAPGNRGSLQQLLQCFPPPVIGHFAVVGQKHKPVLQHPAQV